MARTANKQSDLPPITYIVLIVIAGLWIFKLFPTVQKLVFGVTRDRSSAGEKVLVVSNSNPEKQAGVAAFEQKDYGAAAQHFQAALQQQRNDPETLLYWNNAKVRQGTQPPLRLAVVVPIGSNANVAQEMLRGVAQAQDMIDAKGGINGVGLEIEIYNDDNDPEQAKIIAQSLVDDPSILAVIGHNASIASLAAAPIYQQGRLVMITPTSFASSLSGFGEYIFRTVLDIRLMAVPLADYAVQTAQKSKLVVCYDSKVPDATSFRDEFVAELEAMKGQVLPIACDFSAPSFNPNLVIADANRHNAEGILLVPYIDRISPAIALARANRGKLALFGSTTLYGFQTLSEGQRDMEGMIISVPWSPQAYRGSTFPVEAKRRWSGSVSWRTATSFDATIAAIAALQHDSTRSGVQSTLHAAFFQATGAGDEVKFSPTGDRVGTPILVRVQVDIAGSTFVPLNSPNQ